MTYQVRTHYRDPRAGGAYTESLVDEAAARRQFAWMRDQCLPKGGIHYIELLLNGRVVERVDG
jgi:hypothetical protein